MLDDCHIQYTRITYKPSNTDNWVMHETSYTDRRAPLWIVADRLQWQHRWASLSWCPRMCSTGITRWWDDRETVNTATPWRAAAIGWRTFYHILFPSVWRQLNAAASEQLVILRGTSSHQMAEPNSSKRTDPCTIPDRVQKMCSRMTEDDSSTSWLSRNRPRRHLTLGQEDKPDKLVRSETYLWLYVPSVQKEYCRNEMVKDCLCCMGKKDSIPACLRGPGMSRWTQRLA